MILSAMLIAIVNANLIAFLSFFVLVPVFYFLHKTSFIKSFFNGFVFGFVYGFIMFLWMLKAIIYYSGSSYWYGIAFVIISALGLGLYYGLVFIICKLIHNQNQSSIKNFFINRLAIASVWALMELGLSYLLTGLPLHNSRFGFPLTANIFTIQLASFGGLTLLTFLMVFVNLLCTEFLFDKKYIYLKFAGSVIAIVYVTGGLNYYLFEPKTINKPFTVALVSQNLNPETQWNQKNGNQLAKSIIDQCKDAANQKPDFMVWTESTLPWTYAKNDDLLTEIFKITNGKNITSVVGLNAEINNNKKQLYNSVFYFNDYKEPQVYHKKIPLKGIEEPLGNLLIPFIYSKGFSYKKGDYQQPFQTSFGKVGTLICNESTEESQIIAQTNDGANFFFNLSNDSWFGESCIADQHLYYARLMAVESRKDFAISNNCGYSAMIDSSGKIKDQIKDTAPSMILATINPNSNKTIFVCCPNLVPIILLFMIGLNLITNHKPISYEQSNLKI